MPLLKKILIAVLILFITLVVLIITAYKLVDDRYLKEKIINALEDGLNRQVSIDDDFSLTPRALHPVLNARNVRIASAKWDPQSSLIEADRFQIGIKLLDLFRGIITIENLVFSDATFNITKNEDGLSNLDFNKSGTTPAAKPITPYFVIDKVEMDNVQINYTDRQKELNFTVVLNEFDIVTLSEDQIQVAVFSNINEQPIKLDASMCRIRNLVAGNNCTINAQINFKSFENKINGTLNISGAGHDNNLQIHITGGDINELGLPGDIQLPSTQSVQMGYILRGQLNALQIADLSGKVELVDTHVDIQGSIHSVNPVSGVELILNAFGSQPNWLNLYQEVFPQNLINEFSVRANIRDEGSSWKISDIDSSVTIDKSTLTAKGNILLGSETNHLELDVSAQGDDPEWINHLQNVIAAEKIDQFSLQAGVKSSGESILLENIDSSLTTNNNTITTQGSITVPHGKNPSVSLVVHALGNNLQDFEPLFKQSLPESKSFSINTSLTFEEPKLTLDEVQIEIDSTRLSGNSVVEMHTPPNVHAELKAESIDIEQIMELIPVTRKDASDSSDNSDQKIESLFSDDPIPLDWLDSANSHVSLDLEKLIYKQAELNDLAAQISAKDSRAVFELTSLRYKDANLLSSAIIDGSEKSFAYQLHTEAFDLGELLKEIDANTTFEGKIDASVDLKSNGNSNKQIASNANGKITAIMTEGRVKNAPIDLLAKNLLVELIPGKAKKDSTKIECLFVQFSGAEGLFATDAVILNTENIVMTADGSINLDEETLNLVLIPKPKDIELFTLDANIRVKGDIRDPKYRLDKGSLLKKLLKSAASVALGPAALAIPFANIGTNKTEKCFNEVASTTAKAAEALREAEQKAKESEVEAENTSKETPIVRKAIVESLDF